MDSAMFELRARVCTMPGPARTAHPFPAPGSGCCWETAARDPELLLRLGLDLENVVVLERSGAGVFHVVATRSQLNLMKSWPGAAATVIVVELQAAAGALVLRRGSPPGGGRASR